LNSRGGITVPTSELKSKNSPNLDINIIKSFSPLLCIYKKGSAKLVNISGRLCLDEDSLKREVLVESNALMTLSILELIDHYRQFKDIDNRKYDISNLYLTLARKQLEFYATNLRNIEGVFVDKKNITDDLSQEYKFEEKNKKFKYSDQALLMAAYYRYSQFDSEKQGIEFKNFSLDILKMFLEYRDELYRCSREELVKLCFAFNLFYDYSRHDDAKLMLLDLMEYLSEDEDYDREVKDDIKVEVDSLLLLNDIMFHKNTGIIKFRDKAMESCNKLIELYDPERGIFIKPTEKKEIEYSCLDIAAYLLSILSSMKIFGKTKDSNLIAIDIFRRQLVDSGIILSWPSSPDLDDVERYRNYTSKSEDLLEEQDFRMATLPAPENVELAPLFVKDINYNRKKEVFSEGKPSFESSKNLLIFFMIIYLSKLPDADMESIITN
jgi:hypothetical protein